MDVGFGLAAAAMGAGLISLVSGVLFYRNKPPRGSIVTPIARVRNSHSHNLSSSCAFCFTTF
jgi:hypothetical protein